MEPDGPSEREAFYDESTAADLERIECEEAESEPSILDLMGEMKLRLEYHDALSANDSPRIAAIEAQLKVRS